MHRCLFHKMRAKKSFKTMMMMVMTVANHMFVQKTVTMSTIMHTTISRKINWLFVASCTSLNTPFFYHA